MILEIQFCSRRQFNWQQRTSKIQIAKTYLHCSKSWDTLNVSVFLIEEADHNILYSPYFFCLRIYIRFRI